jgi:integrase
MKNRYRLFERKNGILFLEDRITRKQESLRTRNREAACRILNARNEAHLQPTINLQIARAYLMVSDPGSITRTWQYVMEQIISTKTGNTHERWRYAMQDEAFDSLRHRKLSETSAEHFLEVLKNGTVSTNVFLRRMHNFAVGTNWLPWVVLPKRQWPAVKYKAKRAITLEEHQRIIAREHNPATRAFYQLLWHLGGSQTDIARLTAEDVDWTDHTIAYQRCKTTATSLISFGDEVSAILKTLPESDCLFPALARIHERHRAKLFIKRLATLGISGISLHSYRYSWAERARKSGYPERFAMQALGHGSKAVHHAYSKKAQVRLPSLEAYEQKIVPLVNFGQRDLAANNQFVEAL